MERLRAGQSRLVPGGLVPSRPTRFVSRPRLRSLLDEATTNPLTIVTGPAGVGKTLAVADWAREGNPSGPVVWVTVGEDDREADQLCRTLVEALSGRFGDAAFGDIDLAAGTASIVASMIANLRGTVVLVFDGCEKLSGTGSLGVIDGLLSNPSLGLRVVLLSRHDPALALHRLRLADHLSEVRFSDLAFRHDEARTLLELWDVTLPNPVLERLVEVTEGWAAALRLAVFSLRRAEDPAQLVESFDGVNFLISDYVWDEVLGTLGADVRNFLELTSISHRLCGSLARALSGNPESTQILQTLAREELLVQELDGSGWYRTHPLLTHVLRQRLREERPGLEVEAHRRAVEWFERHGDSVAAIQHAVETRDWDLVGAVALRSSGAIIFSTECRLFADALSGAPPDLAHVQGELVIAQALALSLESHDLHAEAMLERAEALLPSIPVLRRSVATVALRVAQAFQAHHRGDTSSALTAATQADDLLATVDGVDGYSWVEARPMIAMMRVSATLWAGDPDAACRLSRQLADGHPSGRPASYSSTYRLGLLAFMEAVQGLHISDAHDMAQRALNMEIARGLRSTGTPLAWLALSLTELARGNIEAAHSSLDHATQATVLSPDHHIAVMTSIILVRLELASGDLPAARRRLADARRILAVHPGMSLVHNLVIAARVEVELAGGSTAGARAALGTHGPGTRPVLDAVALAEALVLMAEGSPEKARDLITPLLNRPGSIGVEAGLLATRAENRLRRDARSIETFSRALDVAAEEGILHPFLQPSPWLTSSLRIHAQVFGTHHAFVLRALALGPKTPIPEMHEQGNTDANALTERELSVLLHLPGMSSNVEIAAALHISANTVKQHLKSSYRKLGVGSRRDAVRIARDLGLLPN